MGPTRDQGLRIVHSVPGGATGDNLVQTEDGRVWRHEQTAYEPRLPTGQERRQRVGDRLV